MQDDGDDDNLPQNMQDGDDDLQPQNMQMMMMMMIINHCRQKLCTLIQLPTRRCVR